MNAPDNHILKAAIRQGYRPLAAAFVFSCVSNLLFLAYPLYMSNVYSRVITSYSVSTLVVLTIGVIAIYAIQALLDNYRSRVLIQFSRVFDALLSRHVFAALFRQDLTVGQQSQSLRDLDSFRQTLTGNLIGTLYDVPWTPIFLLILFIIDPVIGIVALVGGIILLCLAVLQDRLTRRAMGEINEAALRGYAFTDMALRNAEVVRALGMLPAVGGRWAVDRSTVIDGQAKASARSAAIADMIKFVRMGIQVLVLGIGAYLVIRHMIGPGLLFANMVLAGKALAPVERVSGSWQELLQARETYRRLHKLLDGYQPQRPTTVLPNPVGAISVENATYMVPQTQRPLVSEMSFRLVPGEALGVIGPSGAGKSTLSRLLVGIYAPSSGHVRLDGAEVTAWDRTAFGRHVGYLPQDTEIFTGTVRENIARFRPDVTDAAVVQAAQEAGVHELIVRLPQGYETPLGANGAVLSVGQRQRLGLARALLGEPCLVVLDEPNANLDSDGEAALLNAMLLLKKRGATVVVVSHRANIFRNVDKILFVQNGRVAAFGPRDEILATFMQAAPAPAPQRAERQPQPQEVRAAPKEALP